MTAADWYRNGDLARRIAVVGAARAAEEAREKRPRKAQTPDKPASDAASRASRPDDGTLFGMTTPLRSESGDGPTRLVPLHGTELGPSPDVEGRHGLRGQSPR